MTVKFPIALDSTMLTAYKECPQKWAFEYGREGGGIRLKSSNGPSSGSIHLHAGGAFASALETARKSYYVDKKSWPEARSEGFLTLIREYGETEPGEKPSHQRKSFESMARCYEAYTDKYSFEDSYYEPITLGERRGIEFSFAIPTPILHPDSGDPILYCGRSDAVVQHKLEKTIFIQDEKTGVVGSYWAEQWHLRGQFIGYMWAARQSGIKAIGALVRGAYALVGEVRLPEVIIYHNQYKEDEWLKARDHTIQRMVNDYKQGYFEKSFSHACEGFGGCIFTDLCSVPNFEPLIQFNYEPHGWNPIKEDECL